MLRLPHAIVLACATLSAQQVSGHFAVNPAAPGDPVVLTCTNQTASPLYFLSQCTFYRIHQGSQTGPVVAPQAPCLTIPGVAQPGGTFGVWWNQLDLDRQPVAPGRYWVEIISWNSNYTVQNSDWFCLSIQQPGEPALVETAPAQSGQVARMTIAAPTFAGGLHVAALSLSSNDPITVLGLETCLSLPLFPEAVGNGVGVLDGQGDAGDLTVSIPADPGLVGLGFHVQVLLLSPTADVALTNDLSFTILQ